jgi:hypothetical protein
LAIAESVYRPTFKVAGKGIKWIRTLSKDVFN